MPFVIPYNVLQEVISSFSKNYNTLILIVPAVNRGIPNFGTLRCHSKSRSFKNDLVSSTPKHVAKSKSYINNIRNSNANRHSLFSNEKQNYTAHSMSDGNRLLYTVIEFRVSGAPKMATEVMWARNVRWVSKAL